MENLQDALLKSLETGFIDQKIISSHEYLPQLLINDSNNGKKVLTTIDWELKKCDEFWFSVAFVTTSGIATLMNTLLELQENGIQGKILVSQYLNFSQPEALKKLLRFENIELRIAVEGNFHSKGYLFRSESLNSLIIGSSNLTANALCLNKEWNLKISATSESYIISNALNEFTTEFENAVKVDEDFIAKYEVIYTKQLQLNRTIKRNLEDSFGVGFFANGMQEEALANIDKIRSAGKNKALLISATGTGKTYLSAFDVQKFNPKKFLFVVHRKNIAEAALKTFASVFGDSRSMGFYSGNEKDVDSDFLFSTIQTICREENLKQFEKNHFDYIVIDESHRAGADSYQKILNHFNPKFLLGMTATPERTDGLDIFKLYDHTIAYEIRLHRAMSEGMLSPFHYYGITDITVGGAIIDDKADFNRITSEERIERIIEKVKLYGCDDGQVRGLIFCSKIDECEYFSKEFNKRGYRTISLTGISKDEERSDAILRLESNSSDEKLDYIFTVDIFNEGVDIPSVNQIVMLRPTQSAIVFVQQLGRGLRKVENKDYLTVIDFIGNYSNNFLVPIALYGDTSFNKDNLRKLIASGSSLLPGSSTINFDRIAKEKIFEAIDSANLQQWRDLKNDYLLLKYRLGRIPKMIDFVEQGFRDPFQFVLYSKSYFNFVSRNETNLKESISNEHVVMLELFSMEIANAKRIEEVLILKELVLNKQVDVAKIKTQLENEYNIQFSIDILNSCIRNLNFEFIRKTKKNVFASNNTLYLHSEFKNLLENKTFCEYLGDSLNYAKAIFDAKFISKKYFEGFQLYQKYSRKDVCRILNWELNEEATVYGYKVKYSTCPIFVNYHKEDNIAASTKFDDRFLNQNEFQWFSKPQRTFKSKDITEIKNYKNGLRMPLFIKKSNGEGTDFYFMGDVKPIENTFKETTIKNDKGKDIPVVKVILSMSIPVEDSIFNYLTEDRIDDIKSNVEVDDVKEIETLPYRILKEHEIKAFENSIPLYNICPAAGKISDLQIHDDTKWIELSGPFRYSKEYFVCQIIGESMNKRIPNYSYCLFKRDSGGTRNGEIVLAQHRDIQETEFGAGYTVKSYNSIKAVPDKEDRNEYVILKPLSYDTSFEEIVLSKEDSTELEIIGIFVKVLS